MKRGLSYTDPTMRERLNLLVDLDNEFFRNSSFAARMNRMADERERAGRELDYAKSNRDDAEEFAKKAEPLRVARMKALKALPQAYVRLKKGTRFIAGILDIQEKGGIDFEETVVPYQELAGALYSAGDTQWLIVESGMIERGVKLLSGGLNITSASNAKGIIEQFRRRELSPSAYVGKGLESYVSSENPLALVGIKLEAGDVVDSKEPDFATRNPRRSMIRNKLSRIIEPGDRILDYDRAQGEDLYRLWDMVHTDMALSPEALVEIEGMLDDDGVLVIQSGEEPAGLRNHFRRVTRYNGMLLVQGPMNPEEARINTEKLRRDLE